MFYLRKPSSNQIKTIIETQSALEFTYPAVGSTKTVASHKDGRLTPTSRAELPEQCIVDHNRVQLGSGQAVFEKAKEAVRQWQMFNLGWVRLCWLSLSGEFAPTEFAPIEVGTTVGVLASRPFWSLNTCRIVYTVAEKQDDILRFGFGYGTLPTHVERGEERFQVEWHQHDDSVWYDIVAFSQPNHLLAKVGYPVVRHYQKRFARDSKAAMVRSVRNL